MRWMPLANSFRLSTGAQSGYVLQPNASDVGSWVALVESVAINSYRQTGSSNITPSSWFLTVVDKLATKDQLGNVVSMTMTGLIEFNSCISSGDRIEFIFNNFETRHSFSPSAIRGSMSPRTQLNNHYAVTLTSGNLPRITLNNAGPVVLSNSAH